MDNIIQNVVNSYYGLFGNFYKEFLKKGKALFFIELKKYNFIFSEETRNNILEQFLSELCDELMQVSIRTLIVEIRALSLNGILEGTDRNERYDYYIQMLEENEYRKALRNKYPELWSYLIKRIEYKALLWKECIQRLNNDAAKIKNNFGIEIDKLKNIKMSSGDTHCRGKHVMILEFENNHLIYKPHNMETDILLANVFKIINSTGNTNLKCMKTVDRGEYGWQEYVPLDNIGEGKDLKEYFKRAGELVAVSNALMFTDLHHENIIFATDRPYIIDCESLIYNNTLKLIHRDNKKTNFLKKEMTESVMNSMLLPMASTFSAMDIDIGGLSSSDNQVSQKYYSFEIVDAGTDEIGFARVPSIVKNWNNKIILNNRIVNIRKFRKEIIDGYIRAYNSILNCKNQIIDILKSKNSSVRQVFKPTATYARILEAATYPDYFKSEQSRLRMISKVRKKNAPDWEKFNELEINELLNGDIPYFYTRIGSKSIWCNGIELQNMYERSLLEVVEEHLGHMNQQDLIKQVYYINQSLSTLKKDDQDDDGIRYRLGENHDYVTIIKKLADEMISRGFKASADDNDLMWFYIVDVQDSLKMDISNMSLYYMGGAMLLFLELWNKTREEKYLKIVKCYLERQEKTIDRVNNISVFSGLGAFIYLYFLLYEKTGENEYLKKTERLIENIKERNDIQDSLDVIEGVSGTIVLLSEIREKEEINGIDLVIGKLAQMLVDGLNKNEYIQMTGLAHGYSGYAMALVAAGTALKENKYIQKATEIVNMENKYYNQKNNGWKDIRYRSFMKFDYWCHGSAGILISRIDMLKRIKKLQESKYEKFKNELEKDIHIIGDMITQVNYYDVENFSLCHGLMGQVDALIEYNKFIGKVDKGLMMYLRKRIYSMIAHRGFATGNSGIFEDYTFMCGLSGIAYELLRIQDEKIPSILCMGV